MGGGVLVNGGQKSRSFLCANLKGKSFRNFNVPNLLPPPMGVGVVFLLNKAVPNGNSQDKC